MSADDVLRRQRKSHSQPNWNYEQSVSTGHHGYDYGGFYHPDRAHIPYDVGVAPSGVLRPTPIGPRVSHVVLSQANHHGTSGFNCNDPLMPVPMVPWSFCAQCYVPSPAHQSKFHCNSPAPGLWTPDPRVPRPSAPGPLPLFHHEMFSYRPNSRYDVICSPSPSSLPILAPGQGHVPVQGRTDPAGVSSLCTSDGCCCSDKPRTIGDVTVSSVGAVSTPVTSQLDHCNGISSMTQRDISKSRTADGLVTEDQNCIISDNETKSSVYSSSIFNRRISESMSTTPMTSRRQDCTSGVPNQTPLYGGIPSWWGDEPPLDDVRVRLRTSSRVLPSVPMETMSKAEFEMPQPQSTITLTTASPSPPVDVISKRCDVTSSRCYDTVISATTSGAQSDMERYFRHVANVGSEANCRSGGLNVMMSSVPRQPVSFTVSLGGKPLALDSSLSQYLPVRKQRQLTIRRGSSADRSSKLHLPSGDSSSTSRDDFCRNDDDDDDVSVADTYVVDSTNSREESVEDGHFSPPPLSRTTSPAPAVINDCESSSRFDDDCPVTATYRDQSTIDIRGCQNEAEICAKDQSLM